VGIWDQLNTKTIADNAGTEIQVQSNPVHLQEQNRQDLADIKLINDASMRDGSPMVGTMIQVETVQTDSSTMTPFLTVPKGQVYQVLNYGYRSTGQSGTCTLTVFMGPKGEEASTDAGGFRILYHQTTSSTPVINSDADYRALSPLVLDENFQLNFTFGGTFTNITLRCIAIRIR
jgi:hypothetical protein